MYAHRSFSHARVFMFMSLPPGSFPVLRELTEEERQQILHSSEFQSFFDCSIRVMERALAEDGDIFFDYSGRDLEDKEGWAGRRREGAGGGRQERVSVFGCESTCECLLACLKLSNVLRLTHAHCVTLGAWRLLCSSKYMSSCWCHSLRGLKTPVNWQPSCLKEHCLALWRGASKWRLSKCWLKL